MKMYDKIVSKQFTIVGNATPPAEFYVNLSEYLNIYYDFNIKNILRISLIELVHKGASTFTFGWFGFYILKELSCLYNDCYYCYFCLDLDHFAYATAHTNSMNKLIEDLDRDLVF